MSLSAVVSMSPLRITYLTSVGGGANSGSSGGGANSSSGGGGANSSSSGGGANNSTSGGGGANSGSIGGGANSSSSSGCGANSSSGDSGGSQSNHHATAYTGMEGNLQENMLHKRVVITFGSLIFTIHCFPSEWKLPLCGRITYRHSRWPKILNFLYSSNRFWWWSGRCRHCCSDFCFRVSAILR